MSRESPERITSTMSHGRAREIMGKNFFGVEEAIRHFGVNPSKAEGAALAEIPFKEAELREARSTHVLVAVFPISILDIRERVDYKLFWYTSWYNMESFAKDRGSVHWALVRKTPVEDSTSKTCNEQQALLSENEETPSARVMVYTIIGHYLATGERLFERIYVRTSDLDSDGIPVVVGFDYDGLVVAGCWDTSRDRSVGVVSARLPA